MRMPSAKRLMDDLHVSANDARLIRMLGHAVDDALTLETLIAERCPETQAYVSAMYSNPYDRQIWRVTVALHAIDCIVGTHGVEGLGEGRSGDFAPPYEYLNAGDPYATTLIYSRRSHACVIGCWGDIAERDRAVRS